MLKRKCAAAAALATTRANYALLLPCLLWVVVSCSADSIAEPGSLVPYTATGLMATVAADKIAFTASRDGNSEIYVMNADGTDQARLTNNSSHDFLPAWSPDGTRIAFSSHRDGNFEIYVMNADGTGQTNLTNNPSEELFPAWSPDGAKIAFSSTRDGNREIYVVNADGSGVTRLTNHAAEDSDPTWSPDGQKIAFVSGRDDSGEIYVMNADGTGQTSISNHPGEDRFPAWSPDATKIAFARSEGGYDVYVMNADGSGQARLTVHAGDNYSPAWSPDGTKIAFHTNRDFISYEIYVMNADGTGQTNLTNNTASDMDPSWAAAGNSPPSVSAGGPYTGTEGSSVTFQFSASDPDGDAFTYAWNLGDGTTSSGPRPPTAHAYADDGAYTVTLTVTDGKGGSDTKSTTVAVANVAPMVGPVIASLDPVAINTAVGVSAAFTDAGVLDLHSAVIDWDAGGTSVTSAGGVTESNGTGTVTGRHTYATAGVYTVKVTVSDADGGSSASVFQYVVVYDPDAGFVTGGGWIESPAGAYAADPTLAGKASFGFVSRYKSGATTPSGATQFQFRAGSLDFHSASYEWLVVSGPKAQYKGSGTINGAGDYGFILTANDGDVAGGGGVDKFRIKIWDKATGAVIYDNQLGAADDASASTAIGGGSIVIHK